MDKLENTNTPEYTFEKVWKMFEEISRKFEETDKQFKETDKKINKVAGIFSSQWGKLMEALIEPACLKLFKARGIDVNYTYSNVKVKTKEVEAEFDIVLENGNEVVIIEVKTDMTVKKIDHFLETLSKIKTYLPRYADKKIYGAVAGIKYNEQSDKYAYRQGLFVLRNTGDYIIEIANSKQFSPKVFGV